MTTTDTAPGGEDIDSRLARLANEATAIVRSVDAEGRPFTQAEDDRIKALFNEATALTRQKAGGGLVPLDDVNTLAPPPDRAGFARSSRLAFTPRGEKARRHPWAKAVVEAQRGGPPVLAAGDHRRGQRPQRAHPRDLPRGGGRTPGGLADGDWLGTREAARRLGLASRTLYRLINVGKLPAYRFGRVIRLKGCDLDTFVERSRIGAGTLATDQEDSSSGATRAKRAGCDVATVVNR